MGRMTALIIQGLLLVKVCQVLVLDIVLPYVFLMEVLFQMKVYLNLCLNL
nr:MAG TPA: hypothetical protein [Bacteriophage sp.]